MFAIFKKTTQNKEKSIVKSKPNEIDKMVSKRLKSRRILLGMVQNDIAKAIGVTIQQVQKYENGTNRISAGKLFELAEFLKVPINYFYQQIQEILCEYPSSGNTQTITLVKEFNKIKNSLDRRKVIQMVKMMN